MLTSEVTLPYAVAVVPGQLTYPLPAALRIFSTSDLYLVLEDETGAVVFSPELSAHYTVARSLSGAVTVSFLDDAELLDGRIMVVNRRTPRKQEVRFSELQDLPGTSIELQMDRIFAIAGELDQLLQRALVARRAEALPVLPALSEIAGMITWLNEAMDGWEKMPASDLAALAADLAQGEASAVKKLAAITAALESLGSMDAELLALSLVAAQLVAALGNIATVAGVIDAGGGLGGLEVTAQGAPAPQTLAVHLGWRLDFSSYTPAADGVTDDAAKFAAFCAALQLLKVPGWVGSGEYLLTYVKMRTLTENMRIEFAPDARIVGAATKQVFAGDGVTTSLVVTAWTKMDEFRVVHINGSTETVLTEGTGYTVSGQTINLAGGSAPFGAVPIGQSIRVVDSQPILEFGANAVDLCGIELVGGYFDSSQRGYAQAIDSGSGVLLYNFGFVSCLNGYHYGSPDYDTAQANGVSDTGISSVACSNIEIAGNVFVGFLDNAIYLGGNTNTGEADDGFGASIHSNLFVKCLVGAMSKRQGQGTSIKANTFYKCYIGAGMWPAGSNAIGARGVISGNTFIKTARSAIDVRTSRAPVISDNRIVDVGYELDEVTAIADPCAIKLLGCSNGLVHDNTMLLDAWARTNQIGIQMAAETSYGPTQTTKTRAHHNTIDGFATGCSESGSGTGNIWDENNIVNTTTPMSVLAARRWHYRNSNQEFDGIGTTAFVGDFTPVITLSGASPTITHTLQFGRYIRQGNLVTINCQVQFSYSGTVSANQLRINGLPFPVRNNSTQNMSAVLAYSLSALTLPANTYQMVAKALSNTSYIRIEALLSTGAPTIITTDHIAASTALRLEFTLTYECEPEALN